MKQFSIIFLLIGIFSGSGMGMTLRGSINTSSVTVTGDVTVAEIIVGSLTVTNLNIYGATVSIKGSTVQTIFASTDTNFTTISSTPTAVGAMNASIRLLNPNNYVRISLSGILESELPVGASLVGQRVNLSIWRDSVDLGQGSLISTNNIEPVGMTIIDLPGDTDPHTYQVTIDNGGGNTQVVRFIANPIAFLLLEEIAQ